MQTRQAGGDIADTAPQRPPAAPVRAQLGASHTLQNETQILTTVFLSSSFIRCLSKMGGKRKSGSYNQERDLRTVSIPYLLTRTPPHPQAPLQRSARQGRPGQARPGSTRTLTAAVPARPRSAPQRQAACRAVPRRRAAPEAAPGTAQRRGPRPGRAQPPHRPSPPPPLLLAHGRLPLPGSSAPFPVAGLGGAVGTPPAGRGALTAAAVPWWRWTRRSRAPRAAP